MQAPNVVRRVMTSTQRISAHGLLYHIRHNTRGTRQGGAKMSTVRDSAMQLVARAGRARARRARRNVEQVAQARAEARVAVRLATAAHGVQLALGLLAASVRRVGVVQRGPAERSAGVLGEKGRGYALETGSTTVACRPLGTAEEASAPRTRGGGGGVSAATERHCDGRSVWVVVSRAVRQVS